VGTGARDIETSLNTRGKGWRSEGLRMDTGSSMSTLTDFKRRALHDFGPRLHLNGYTSQYKQEHGCWFNLILDGTKYTVKCSTLFGEESMGHSFLAVWVDKIHSHTLDEARLVSAWSLGVEEVLYHGMYHSRRFFCRGVYVEAIRAILRDFTTQQVLEMHGFNSTTVPA